MPGTADELVEQLNQLRIEYGDSNPDNPSTSNHPGIERIVREVLKNMSTPNIRDFSEPNYNISLNARNVNELDRTPDMVKCLREFSGRPGEFSSWRKSVDRIFKAYEELKDTPRYFAILHTIRHKIIGDADTALESYSTPLDWTQIRKYLMMHYSDKRDNGTLEYQMTTLAQRHDDIPTFYQKVYQHLSLILDKISCLDLSDESIRAMTNSYRDKALDTFIRGLNGDLPRLLSIREPNTLPQALHLCQKLDNMSFRMNHAHTVNRSFNNTPPRPPRHTMNHYNNRPFYPELTYFSTPRMNLAPRQQTTNRQPSKYPQNSFAPQTFRPHQSYAQPNRYNYPQYDQGFRTNGIGYNYQANQANRPNLPPKPPVPMDVDRSLHSRQVNYQNRPVNNQNNFAPKRPLSTQQAHPPNKLQRTYHTDTVAPDANNYQIQADPNQIFRNTYEGPQERPAENNINFMAEDRQEYDENEYIECDTIHFFRLTPSSLPYYEFTARSGDALDFLIDTGSNKNYIQSSRIRNPIPNEQPFKVKSVAGNIEITHHTYVDIFGHNVGKIKFYILPTLNSFHGIIGNDTLKQMKATIHTDKNMMTIFTDIVVPLKQRLSQEVNNVGINIPHLPAEMQAKINNIINRCPNLFSDPDQKLTYTTIVKGEIRTTSDTPVYSKPYPYPMALKEEIERQIEELLDDGIIRRSKSPYNSPVWIVDKKTDASGKKKYRMVIDYRKLNAITIPDKYPIPEINEVLANLGNNKLFTVIDLKSGFHQIPLRESDIEKTAFSVNNGKYEFLRLPFGLKNAPSTFQRALDDILRQHIGIRCYVYIDDVIIFGKTEEEHLNNIELVFRTLEQANMKVQLNKCEFAKEEVEFLGYVITPAGIKTNPKKVEAVAQFPIPRNLKELRSFLGMSGYYRRFIRDYSQIAKPLTALLRGEAGNVSKRQSRKIDIELDKDAIEAFNKIKSTLVSRDITLVHPNFDRDFELTTDASHFAIGAVLSQDNRPITFISRTLNKTEENYATNEKEMLAIIWSLNTLRSYLYGSKKVKIITDHQPLTYALSHKNANSKMKRWKAILEEYNHEMVYRPGKSNVVADALSRISNQINTLTPTIHSDESSSHNLIPCAEVPINVFKNQIFFKQADTASYQFKIVFPTIHRHIIEEPQFNEQIIIGYFKRYLNPSVINGIHTDEGTMGIIQKIYPDHFSNFKCRYTQKLVQDIVNEQEQEEVILKEHLRAHRNAMENKTQILENNYFPGMTNKIKRVITNCTVCKENKYERHPNQPKLAATPLPTFPGHTIHVDIFLTEGKKVMTALDKFTKFAVTKILNGRATEDVRRPLRDIVFFFGVPKIMVMDNEPSLNSTSIQFMLKDELGIEVYTTPPYKSQANGQVERFHSTVSEIMRCIKENGRHRNFEELLERAVSEYNHTIHSVTRKRPVDLFFGRNVAFTPEDMEKTRHENLLKLAQKQSKDIEYHNKRKQTAKSYLPGQVIYVKKNRRLGTKLSKLYSKEVVKEDRTSTVITEKDKSYTKVE